MRNTVAKALLAVALLCSLVAAQQDAFFPTGATTTAVRDGASYLSDAKELGANWAQIGGFAVDY